MNTEMLTDADIRELRKMMMTLSQMETNLADYQEGHASEPQMKELRSRIDAAIRATEPGQVVAALEYGYDELGDYLGRKFGSRPRKYTYDPQDIRDITQVAAKWGRIASEARTRMERWERREA